LPRIPARVLLLIAGTLITICLEQATSARALVEEVSGTKVGMQAPEIRRYWDGNFKGTGLNTAGESNPSALNFANAGANPVLHSLSTYAIYWDPQDYYHGDWEGVIDNFLANLGIAAGQLSNVFSVDTQYRDSTNQGATSHSSFRGAYTDTNAYPASACTHPHPPEAAAPLQEGHAVCLTDGQIRSQLQTFIAQHGLPAGMGTIYY